MHVHLTAVCIQRNVLTPHNLHHTIFFLDFHEQFDLFSFTTNWQLQSSRAHPMLFLLCWLASTATSTLLVKGSKRSLVTTNVYYLPNTPFVNSTVRLILVFHYSFRLPPTVYMVVGRSSWVCNINGGTGCTVAVELHRFPFFVLQPHHRTGCGVLFPVKHSGFFQASRKHVVAVQGNATEKLPDQLL